MTRAPDWTRGSVAGLIAVCAVAAALRLPGLDAHLPDIYWHDELNFVEGGLRVGAGEIVAASFGGYSHGTLTYYLLFAAFALYFVAGRLAGIFQGPDDLVLSYVTDPSPFVLIARVVMLAAMMGAVGLTFALARRLFGPRAGWIAAVLLAVSFQSVQITLGKEDGLFALFVLAAVWYAVRIVEEPGTPWRVALLGALAGGATAVKYFGVFLLPLLATTVLLAGRARPAERDLARQTGLAAVVFALVFFLLVPGVLLDTGRFVSSFRALASVNTGTMFTDTRVTVSPWYGYLWTSLSLANGPVAAALFYAAALWLARWRPRQAALLLIYPAALVGALTLTLVFGRPAEAVNFYLMSALPLFCVASGGWLAQLMSYGRAARLAGIATLLTIAATNVIDDLRFERLLGLADTRTIARQWIEQHVADGASILVEGAIGTFVLEGPQLRETEASLARELDEIRRQGGGGGLWAAKLRAAGAAGGGLRRFDVHKVRDITSNLLETTPPYVVVRGDEGRRIVEASGAYSLVFTAPSDSPALFRTVPLLSSRDIARLRRIPLVGDPQFTPGPSISVYRAASIEPEGNTRS
jgi:hypothetical protein